MAATNKCLAQSNKSCAEGWATKKVDMPMNRGATTGHDAGRLRRP